MSPGASVTASAEVLSNKATAVEARRETIFDPSAVNLGERRWDGSPARTSQPSPIWGIASPTGAVEHHLRIGLLGPVRDLRVASEPPARALEPRNGALAALGLTP